MTSEQVLGLLVLLTLCPALGALPLTDWIVRLGAGKRLHRLGTGNMGAGNMGAGNMGAGNMSVSAAFYHAGPWWGLLAVSAEALKGLGAVWLARQFFPLGSGWEWLTIGGAVLGRYWVGRGAGMTTATWGAIAHEPVAAGLTAVLTLAGFAVMRDRQTSRLLVLAVYPLMLGLLHPNGVDRVVGALLVAAMLGWLCQTVPDDLSLARSGAAPGSQATMGFFQGRADSMLSLGQTLDADRAGRKAATLARLKAFGYPVLPGWVLLPGDDPVLLANRLAGQEELTEGVAQAIFEPPLIVRSSAIGEYGDRSAAAGLYETLADVRTPLELVEAVAAVFQSYDRPAAVEYRRDRGLPDQGMAVLVQPQISGAFSGVAFSRDPVTQQGETVLVEALPGDAAQVVSGRITPESYRIEVNDMDVAAWRESRSAAFPNRAASQSIEAELRLLASNSNAMAAETGTGDVPSWLVREVALLARDLELHFDGVPQDLEWTFDGQNLWILQARPITTLLPVWTRRIAADVIPGTIRPLTWSINRSLTCGAWGRLCTLVLGNRAKGIDFLETATLFHGHAYFNVTLLGDLFRRMGLPPESLEALTRGGKMTRPPLSAILRNVPGLLRLVGREWGLERSFQRDWQQHLQPGLAGLEALPAEQLAEPDRLLVRVDCILGLLDRTTDYSILAPLSAALRQSIGRVDLAQLDAGRHPEVAATRWLQGLARRMQTVLSIETIQALGQPAAVWDALAAEPAGREVIASFHVFLETYGYLSEVGTDVAIPTWREVPEVPQAMLVRLAAGPIADNPPVRSRTSIAQRRLDLKGQVAEVYNKLLAELRWTLVTLEQRCLSAGLLPQVGDIFYLEIDEVRQLVADPQSAKSFEARITQRRQAFAEWKKATIPSLVYGQEPPLCAVEWTTAPARSTLRGLGGSPGQAEGRVIVIRSLEDLNLAPAIGPRSILVVPYVDAAWGPLLVRAGGLICEAGGRLSHGAIVAREYRIPAVFDVPNVTQRLRTGQRLRIDGTTGAIDILD
jgi:pyruvate,water dikinase